MSLLNKSHKKISSRRQINIKEVKDGVLILPRNRYRTVLETSSVNFELKSSEEQDVIIDSFQNFLNSLTCPIQILIRVRELDIDSYLEQIKKMQGKEVEAVYKLQAKNYSEFIEKLVEGNKILSRRFFIVIAFEATENKDDFDFIKKQLLINQDIVVKGLEKLGMKARQLDSLEVLNMFYSFYSPELAKTQELKAKTFESLLEKTYVS
jgi:hypothetical protein